MFLVFDSIPNKFFFSFDLKTAFGTFWGPFGENWATFNPGVWSHWVHLKLQARQIVPILFRIKMLKGRLHDGGLLLPRVRAHEQWRPHNSH